MVSMSSSSSALPARVDALRAFNRFYTRRIGVLHEGWAESKYSLTETRLLWEIAHAGNTTASSLARTLALDAGYLSRLLRGLRERGLVRSERSEDDARHVHLQLSAAGRRALAPLEARTRDETAALLATLSDAEQQRLLQALGTITQLLADPPRPAATPYLLRPPRAGDIGWVIARHGALYAQEYGWDARFEALAARIAADFVEHYDPTREACWIAERDGHAIGYAQAGPCGLPHPDVRPGDGELKRLYLRRSEQNGGVGRALMDAAMAWLERDGPRPLWLSVWSENTGAQRFYGRYGFEFAGDFGLVETKQCFSQRSPAVPCNGPSGQALQGGLQLIQIDRLNLRLDDEPGHRIEINAGDATAQPQRLHDRGTASHEGIKNDCVLRVRIVAVILIELRHQIGGRAVRLYRRLQCAQEDRPEHAGGAPREPLVHLVDGLEGIPLRDRQPVDSHDGKSHFDGSASG